MLPSIMQSERARGSLASGDFFMGAGVSDIAGYITQAGAPGTPEAAIPSGAALEAFRASDGERTREDAARRPVSGAEDEVPVAAGAADGSRERQPQR